MLSQRALDASLYRGFSGIGWGLRRLRSLEYKRGLCFRQAHFAPKSSLADVPFFPVASRRADTSLSNPPLTNKSTQWNSLSVLGTSQSSSRAGITKIVPSGFCADLSRAIARSL